jgi:hypothetical protein
MSKQRQQNEAVRFEPKDVPPLLALLLAAGLAGFVIIVLVGITLGYTLADRQQYRGPLQHLPPAPRLQVAPVQELRRYEEAKAKELQHSPLPIDAAMRATAQQGWGTLK